MDFSSSLRPGEKIVWSGTLEKQAHDMTIKPAPVLAEESRPRMFGVRKEDADSISPLVEHRIVRAIRGKWGIRA
jgi:hypothetical protein